MKKIKTAVTALVMLLATTAFATDPVKVSPVIKAAFESHFVHAENVSWNKTSDFYFASFTLNQVKVDAAYNEKGELVGTSRIINKDQMPLGIALTLANRYVGYQIDASVIELTYEEVTRYYVQLENAKQVVKLKCYTNGDVFVEEKINKPAN